MGHGVLYYYIGAYQGLEAKRGEGWEGAWKKIFYYIRELGNNIAMGQNANGGKNIARGRGYPQPMTLSPEMQPSISLAS